MQQQLKLYILLAMIAVACASTRAWAQVNYDESKVKPYTLEDPLRFVNGKKVKNLKDWELRRQEILGIFQSRIPSAYDSHVASSEEHAVTCCAE